MPTTSVLTILKLIPLLMLLAIATVACNTVEGAGKDVESAGEGLQDLSNDVKRDIH